MFRFRNKKTFLVFPQLEGYIYMTDSDEVVYEKSVLRSIDFPSAVFLPRVGSYSEYFTSSKRRRRGGWSDHTRCL